MNKIEVGKRVNTPRGAGVVIKSYTSGPCVLLDKKDYKGREIQFNFSRDEVTEISTAGPNHE